MNTNGDQNDCANFERTALRVFIGLGMLVTLLAILALGVVLASLFNHPAT